MKIVLAVDSFKGTFSSVEIIETLGASIEKNWGAQEIVKIPVADGGEGTVEALVVATGGEIKKAWIVDSFGTKKEVPYGLIWGETAVLEMAAIEGLGMMRSCDKNPLKTSSHSLGQLLLHVLDCGIKKIMIGIGGSASNDGGMGFLSALGAKFYDEDGHVLNGRGEDLERVSKIDLDQMDSRLKDVEISVICDVTNPLLGANGATFVYGVQKGAVGELAIRLEKGMKHYADAFQRCANIDIDALPGAGAAGGVGAALGCVLHAKIVSGIDAVLDFVHFDTLIEGADLVVTGEGRLDYQSVKYGKVPVGIAKRCQEYNIPVAIVVGCLGDGWEDVFSVANCSILSTVDKPMELDEAISNAPELLCQAADKLFRMIGLIVPGLNKKCIK